MNTQQDQTQMTGVRQTLHRGMQQKYNHNFTLSEASRHAGVADRCTGLHIHHPYLHASIPFHDGLNQVTKQAGEEHEDLYKRHQIMDLSTMHHNTTSCTALF